MFSTFWETLSETSPLISVFQALKLLQSELGNIDRGRVKQQKQHRAAEETSALSCKNKYFLQKATQPC